MTARQTRSKTARAEIQSPTELWSRLTWRDLEQWAGSSSVSRGRSYQRAGNVQNLAISAEGRLLATVTGGDRYAVLVWCNADQKPDSSCTCPVGSSGCKHAVAVVAEYLQILADARPVPTATTDDPRWAKLEGLEEDEAEEDFEDDELEHDNRTPISKDHRASTKKIKGVDADEQIEQRIRQKSHEELANLVCQLTERFPELREEFQEQIALETSDVKRLTNEARREIRRVTSETGWRNHWTGEGHTPDYSKIDHRLKRLLELGQADSVVALGQELVDRGFEQIGQSQDEGETGTAFAECLPVVFRAVRQSTLTPDEKLLFAIDIQLRDDYGIIDDASNEILEANWSRQDWSALADALFKRLKSTIVAEKTDSFSRDFARDQMTNWLVDALHRAGRDSEMLPLYESEARVTHSYERLVRYLIGKKQYDDAKRWACEGIAAVAQKWPGIASQLTTLLREMAERRKQWDLVAAHAACDFFESPSAKTFTDLLAAAKKAKVEESVDAAARQFLETGELPFQISFPQQNQRGTKPSKSSHVETGRSTLGFGSENITVKVDPTWPLPLPDYLAVVVKSSRGGNRPEGPNFDALVDIAIAANQPDEVLRWYDKMPHKAQPSYGFLVETCDDRVAAAVAELYPQRAIDIYTTALHAHLPQANQIAYQSATAYLRKMRPLYTALECANAWTALVVSIREKYRNRPRFMELLDGLDDRTIVRSQRRKGR